jgi:hypothetical protein
MFLVTTGIETLVYEYEPLNIAAGGTVLISIVATSKEGQINVTKCQEHLDFFNDGVVHYNLISPG